MTTDDDDLSREPVALLLGLGRTPAAPVATSERPAEQRADRDAGLILFAGLHAFCREHQELLAADLLIASDGPRQIGRAHV